MRHFGPVAEVSEGDVTPLPLAGVFEFPTLAAVRAFYESSEYAEIKIDRDTAREACMYIVDGG